MDIGMLWFDNDQETDLRAKLARAATYYRNKYGQTPNLCFIHPAMEPENGHPQNGLEVRTSSIILPHHFWLGVNHSETRKENQHA